MLSAATYALGSFICHQQPERSFHFGIAQLPVCARCTGLYAGAALGAVTFISISREKITWREPLWFAGVPQATAYPTRYEGARLYRVLLWSAVPTLITWAVEAAGVAAVPNVVRAIAAFPLGIVVGGVVVAALAGRLR